MGNPITESDLTRAFMERDFAYLSDIVRNNVELDDDARDLLAEIILGLGTGKLKNPNHRPKNLSADRRSDEMVKAVFAYERDGWPRKAAVVAVSDKFGCSPRWVSHALKTQRECEHLGEIVKSACRELIKREHDLGKPMLRRMRHRLLWGYYPDEEPK
jgi:hypothetical protein